MPAARVFAVAALLFAACAHGGAAPAGNEVVLSVTGLDCAECFDMIAAELEKEAGVAKVTFDKVRVEVHAWAAPGTDPARLVAAVERAGYHASVGAGDGAYVAAVGFPPSADVQFLAKTGEDVPALAQRLAPAKLTVFDFYADWCAPCRQVDDHMKQVLATRADIAYRKLNIVDWDTPLAKRYMASIAELPYLIVYAADGRRLGEVSGLHLDKLDALLGAAGAR
jgi:thiol-disulfide isomerase/thioredoxin